MDKIINFQILKHPMNWIIVFLMIFIVTIGLHYILMYQTGTSASGSLNSRKAAAS